MRRFALGHKKGENCQKQTKIMDFSSELLIFASDSLESGARHLHLSFLKSESGGIAHGRPFVKSESLTVALL